MVDDMISRQAAIDALARMMPRSYTPDGSHPADEEIFRAQEVFADCIEALEILPSADVEPVRHGRWTPGKEISRTMLGGEVLAIEYTDWHCSECGHRYREYVLPYNFCPNCGARMDGEQDD